MASTTTLRSRENAAQIRALAGVEPELRAFDQSWRRKYLQDYADAFRSYESVLRPAELEQRIARADTILVGDYHALPACQYFVAKLLKDCAAAEDPHRPVVLALETVFSRDQHILDEWWRKEIRESELRRRIRFDLDWGYDWEPFYDLLITARDHADGVYGVDCMPREDLRKIGARDRHASHKIAEIRQRHPTAVIVTLVGESHLAPAHLPSLVRAQLKKDDVLTILQNVDALYWRASAEQAETVRVDENILCVFNSTPLEKYESYRRCLERWNNEQDRELDFVPIVYSLIDGLFRFLDIDRYCSHNGTQPKFLVDLLPEVCSPSELKKSSGGGFGENQAKAAMRQLKSRGCVYVPHANTFVVREFEMHSATEEAARFVHHACQGLPLTSTGSAQSPSQCDEQSAKQTIEDALVCVGSQILCRVMTATSGRAEIQEGDDRYPRRRRNTKMDSNGADSDTIREGQALGADLYDAYLQGQLRRTDLKRLFLVPITKSGTARALREQLARKLQLLR